MLMNIGNAASTLFFRRRTIFLDVGAERWYSIKADDDESRDDGFETVSVFMNDGLVCELTRFGGYGGHRVLSRLRTPGGNSQPCLHVLTGTNPSHNGHYSDIVRQRSPQLQGIFAGVYEPGDGNVCV